MTSNDNSINMSELILILEKNFALTQAQIADIKTEMANFRADVKDDIAVFKDEMRIELQGVRSEIADVRSELKSEIADVRSEIASVRSELKAEIADVRSEVRIQSTRIDNLVHWNYWFIALFVAFFLMPSVIEGVRSTFKAISDDLTALFKRK